MQFERGRDIRQPNSKATGIPKVCNIQKSARQIQAADSTHPRGQRMSSDEPTDEEIEEDIEENEDGNGDLLDD